MSDREYPMIWAGQPSRVFHLAEKVTRTGLLTAGACGMHGRPIEEVELPTGVAFTTCAQCRSVLGV